MEDDTHNSRTHEFLQGEYAKDDYGGKMIFEDRVGLKIPDVILTGEEKSRKNLTQETCPNMGLKPGPLHDRRACYRLFHSVGHK